MTKLFDELYTTPSGILRPETLDSLRIVSGKVVACDPLAAHTQAFERTVQPGTYPVVAWWHEKEGCIAAVELKLSDAKPVRWEMATRPGQHVNELQEGYIFGYPVDTGLGCFADVEAVNKMDELEDRLMHELGEDFISLYDNLIEDILFEHEDNWGNAIVYEDAGLNMIVFRSGYGDGFYASYWGIDEQGQIASLVTDFTVL